MKTFLLLLIVSSFAACFASSDPCNFPQNIGSRDIVFIGQLVREELTAPELKVKISKRHINSVHFSKLTFLVDTTLYGEAKDTMNILQLLDVDGYENFQVGMQYCMHAKYTKQITFLFDTIKIDGYMTNRCSMRITASYAKGVPLEPRFMEDISKYCQIPKAVHVER